MTEELKIYITAQIDDLKKELNKGKKEVQDFEKKNKASFEEVSQATQKAGEISKKALAVVGTAVVGAAASLLALSSATKEYRENQAKLKTAFESAGASSEAAKNTYNELFRVLGEDDRSVEAANHLGMLTQNQKDLSTWTNICQGVYATFGDSLPIEGLTEAANETAKTGALTGVLADALNWAGIKEDDFQAKLDKCNTEAEREQLIRETLNKTYSEAAAGYEKNAAGILAQNEAQIKMNEATAKLGEAVAPLQTALAEVGVIIAEKLTPYIETFMNEHGEALKQTLTDIATAIGNAISWIADNWEMISTIGTIILAIATAITIVSTALSVYNTIMAIVNSTMWASPITWIIAGITALIAAIILCIVYWDEIKEAVSKAFEKIKEIVSKIVDSVKQKIEDFKNAIREKFEAIKTGMQEKIQAAKQKVLDIVENIKTGFKEKIQAAKDTVLGIFDKIKSGITEKINGAKDKVKSIIDTIKGFFHFEFNLPKIKTPKFSITPEGWKVGDLLKGSIPKLSIKWNAEGGVFTRPTIVPYGNTLQGLGEAGAEAIVPLENNTEWLDKIANKLASKQGNTPIVLNVDGKTFAQTTINTINELTRQTGSLKLNLV